MELGDRQYGSFEGRDNIVKRNAIYETLEKVREKKSTKNFRNRITLTLPNGAKERLKKVAEHQEERYHTLAANLIMKHIKHIERKLEKNK